MTANNRENCSRRLYELPPRLLRLCNGIVFSRIIAPFTLQSLIVAAIYSCSSICQRKCFHRLTGARSLASKYTTEHLNSKTLNFPSRFKLPDFNHISFHQVPSQPMSFRLHWTVLYLSITVSQLFNCHYYFEFHLHQVIKELRNRDPTVGIVF